jgi:hypothetical protein
MKTAAAIRTRFRVHPLNAIVFILAASVSGWAQAPPANQKHETAGKHAKTIEYRNVEYGFALTLPESWKGYRVLWSEWDGSVYTDDGNVARTLQGPSLVIRHPKWTQENPREDMPIMIYTIAQWNDDPIVSAAPFGPSELGRNQKYVFALRPRWNYDFSEGWEEAAKILNSDSLHTFAPAK